MDPQYQYTPQGAPMQQPPGNGIAVASMVLGIVSLVLFFLWFLAPILGLLAVIFGALGIGKANKIGGKGKGMAIAGLVTGALGLIVSIIIIVLAFVVVSKSRRGFGEVDVHHDPIALVAPATTSN